MVIAAQHRRPQHRRGAARSRAGISKVARAGRRKKVLQIPGSYSRVVGTRTGLGGQAGSSSGGQIFVIIN